MNFYKILILVSPIHLYIIFSFMKAWQYWLTTNTTGKIQTWHPVLLCI